MLVAVSSEPKLTFPSTVSRPDNVSKVEAASSFTSLGPTAAVGRTGRLIVASEDRSFAGFVRSIQGHVVEKFPGVPTRALGQKNVPGIAQNLKLEEATILTDADIVTAGKEIVAVEVGGVAKTQTLFVPNRYFIS